MNKENMIYISTMQDTLKHKNELLKKILMETQRQEKLLSEEEFDTGEFDELLDLKEILIHQLLDLDQGFQRIYTKVKGELEEYKLEHKTKILDMQNWIRLNTDLGVRIQALEQKNKKKFDLFVMKKKREIQGFRISNQMTSKYTQHMTNQYQQGQSFYVDKKK